MLYKRGEVAYFIFFVFQCSLPIYQWRSKGGNRGIGLGICRQLALNGVKIILSLEIKVAGKKLWRNKTFLAFLTSFSIN
ncbi:hypothetical protein HanRHA438_Chr04g0188731 [Helianthus annuus]|nr:hypothetical protein HanIR_Chr04g0192801 [Helianthus annuus]KAJ0762185.1 hypothetical protein HanOQP8_Chr04g0158581 [Helianthus annuus]KAJ0927954.1 hypothetical protein HanRHA438_Chr04g0188731 [Helianthus annuus]